MHTLCRIRNRHLKGLGLEGDMIYLSIIFVNICKNIIRMYGEMDDDR